MGRWVCSLAEGRGNAQHSTVHVEVKRGGNELVDGAGRREIFLIEMGPRDE